MKRTAIMAVAALFLGAAQVASASFCPFSSSKKTHRPPPMMRPAYPVVLMPVVQQPGSPILTALQPVYLVPAYGMPPRPAPWAMPQYRYR